MNFDLTAELRLRLGDVVVRRINAYFDSLEERPVQVEVGRRSFAALEGAMPEDGILYIGERGDEARRESEGEAASGAEAAAADEAERVLEGIIEELVEHGFHVGAANYFGLMNPTPTYVAVLAEALVAALNPQLATLARSQMASKIELQTLRWIGERVGWPGEFDGTFTSGGNEANFSALAMAVAAQFPESVEAGVGAIEGRPMVYASEEAHHSIDKSAGLLGLGRSALRRVAVDSRARMDVTRLRELVRADLGAGRRPFCVVATAGTTNSGAVDDMNALADLCGETGMWLHVDGAYGAAAIFSDAHREVVRGIERADSVTVDPHKWLAMPFAAGVVLTRNPEMLARAFGTQVPYMPRVAGREVTNNFQTSAQWSRRANSVKLWLTLKMHGRLAYEEHIGRQMELKEWFAEWVRRSEHFELVMEPELPIVNLRVKAKAGWGEAEVAAENFRVVEAVTASGERWISETQVAGKSVIRVMVISYLTGEKQLTELGAALEGAAGE